MKKLLLLGLMLAALSAGRAGIEWNTPSNVNSGSGYEVRTALNEAGMSYTWLDLYKNNAWVGHAEGWDNPTYLSYGSTDFGNQTINYHASAAMDHWYVGLLYDSSDFAVTVTVPNSPPTIAWVVNPNQAPVGETFNIQARANDADGNLASISVFRDGVPFALDGANGSEGYSNLNGYAAISTGTVTFTAYAQDQNGLYSETIPWTVNIYQPNRSPDTPTISSDEVTQINLGQSVHLTGTLHDPDGNLAYHNLFYASPSSGGWPTLLSGTPSNGSNSTISTYFTPTELGTWQFNTNGHDGQSWGPGATLSINVVDGTPPSTPTGLTSSGVGGSGFTLSWNAATDNVGVSVYEVFRNGASLGTTGSTSMILSGLTQGTAYSMTVRAKDAAGNVSTSSATLVVNTADTQAPSTPAGLAAGNVAATSFTLSWSASSDNLAVTAYEVRRGTTSLGTTGNLSLAITGLTQGTAYSLTVRARDAADNWSGWSNPLVVTTADTQAPSVPVGLAASNIGTTNFTLSWSAATDNLGVTGYEVMRGTTSLGTTTALSLSVGGLAPSTTYAMTVRARDAADNRSAWSTALNVTTSPPGSTTDTDCDGIPDVIEQQLGTDPTVGPQADINNQSALKIHRPNP